MTADPSPRALAEKIQAFVARQAPHIQERETMTLLREAAAALLAPAPRAPDAGEGMAGLEADLQYLRDIPLSGDDYMNPEAAGVHKNECIARIEARLRALPSARPAAGREGLEAAATRVMEALARVTLPPCVVPEMPCESLGIRHAERACEYCAVRWATKGLASALASAAAGRGEGAGRSDSQHEIREQIDSGTWDDDDHADQEREP